MKITGLDVRGKPIKGFEDTFMVRPCSKAIIL
jgi:hypothetical protein